MVFKRMSLVEELKDKALEILQESRLPLGVGDVAKRLDVSWTTARAILLTLEAEGKISSLKTSKSKVFYPKRERTPRRKSEVISWST